ncbi:Oidioi.mRNA.OKI2018_I69.PAR.g9792.t1.cds [Oikopleura dioica]|uniref:Oidioi.mRNA.OKI2018_I69.PAR.g9792.t1.cds n=1 Tax=Oikopleura dioica TaxID=34765 RepID=A0ABN7RMH1_OIKDI|nr:Oidioi.mRNA.OKI2018_I69.PAR.g9792.t1.cds [Oikopleura dioica]
MSEQPSPAGSLINMVSPTRSANPHPEEFLHHNWEDVDVTQFTEYAPVGNLGDAELVSVSSFGSNLGSRDLLEIDEVDDEEADRISRNIVGDDSVDPTQFPADHPFFGDGPPRHQDPEEQAEIERVEREAIARRRQKAASAKLIKGVTLSKHPHRFPELLRYADGASFSQWLWRPYDCRLSMEDLLKEVPFDENDEYRGLEGRDTETAIMLLKAFFRGMVRETTHLENELNLGAFGVHLESSKCTIPLMNVQFGHIPEVGKKGSIRRGRIFKRQRRN